MSRIFKKESKKNKLKLLKHKKLHFECTNKMVQQFYHFDKLKSKTSIKTYRKHLQIIDIKWYFTCNKNIAKTAIKINRKKYMCNKPWNKHFYHLNLVITKIISSEGCFENLISHKDMTLIFTLWTFYNLITYIYNCQLIQYITS